MRPVSSAEAPSLPHLPEQHRFLDLQHRSQLLARLRFRLLRPTSFDPPQAGFIQADLVRQRAQSPACTNSGDAQRRGGLQVRHRCDPNRLRSSWPPRHQARGLQAAACSPRTGSPTASTSVTQRQAIRWRRSGRYGLWLWRRGPGRWPGSCHQSSQWAWGM